MFGSPTSNLIDLHVLLGQYSKTSLDSITSTKDVGNQKPNDLIHFMTISYYVSRLSWSNKLKFLTELSERIRSISSISLLLNILQGVIGKITFYKKSTNTTSYPYDAIVNDHDRMLDESSIKRSILQDLDWFEDITDSQQVSVLIDLMRLCGGSIILTLYKRLQKLYARRSLEIKKKLEEREIQKEVKLKEKLSKIKMSEQNDEEIHDKVEYLQFEYDPEDPNHQECLKLTKKYNDMMISYRKQVEKNIVKDESRQMNKKKDKDKVKHKEEKKRKEKSKKKGKTSKKSKGKKESDSVDWIQLMPIWIVKKIFGYLDKKTLKKAQKVNEYWKWAITDLMKDMKVGRKRDQIVKKMKQSWGPDFESPVKTFSTEKPKKRISFTEKRLKKLLNRGAILEELRHISEGPLIDKSLLIGALEVAPYNFMYLENIAIDQRYIRKNETLYKRPNFICKDYNIICKEIDVVESCQEVNFYNTSEYFSISSDEMEF